MNASHAKSSIVELELESWRGAQVLGGSGSETGTPTAAKGSSKLFGTTPKATAGPRKKKDGEEEVTSIGIMMAHTCKPLFPSYWICSCHAGWLSLRGVGRPGRWCTRKSRSPKKKKKKWNIKKAHRTSDQRVSPRSVLVRRQLCPPTFRSNFWKIIIWERYSTCNKSTDTDLLALFAPNVFPVFPCCCCCYGGAPYLISSLAQWTLWASHQSFTNHSERSFIVD